MDSSSKDVPIILKGAPDTVLGQSGAEPKSLQMMHLDMNSDVLEELLAAARNGKQPQVAFGRVPTLSFGSRSLNLGHRPTRIRPEIYRVDNEDSWTFTGHVSHNLSIQKVEDSSAGLDEALAMLKNNMASIVKESEARKTITLASKKTATKPNQHLHPQDNSLESPDMNRSTVDWIIKHKTPAIRHSLVHILAIKPETLQECSKKACALKAAIEPILEKIATKNTNDEWEMNNKSFKDVKPWSFRYSTDQRQAIIEKAIKAYDRLRIDPKDPIWQDLLPPGERNKGKTLSRLAFNSQNLTPNMTPKVVDKKTGLPKRPETKKVNDVKAKEKATGKLSPHPNKDKDIVSKSSKTDQASSKVGSADAGRKIPKIGQSPAHRPVKDNRASASAKALLNRPRNPSPLSKSPPVNASDFEDNHPVHKTFAAAPSPSRSSTVGSAKRKVQVSAEARSTESANKKARIETLHGTAKTGKSSPALKRKAEENTRTSSSSSSDNTPLKIRRLAQNGSIDKSRSAPSKTAAANVSSKYASSSRPRSDTQLSDDSSVTSPDYALSHSKRLQLAEEFKRYYGKYKHFHMELSSRNEPPSKDQMERLMAMHNRVADMKKSLATN